MERKVTKKIGTCKCKQYKEEIKELNDIIYDLKQKLNENTKSPALQFTKEINDCTSFEEFKLPNSFSEFDAQIKEINQEKKNPSFKELENELNEMNEMNEMKEIFKNEMNEFNLDEFNKRFNEMNEKNEKNENILFKTEPRDINEDLEYKKDYNPNILPIKVITGFEKFNKDEFNRQFKEQNPHTLMYDW